jgi:hypothetical protein
VSPTIPNSRERVLFAHDLSEKPGSTFSAHALASSRKGDPERRIRMGEDAMSRSVAVLFLAAAFAMPAAAADMPSRKAGLWEVTTHVDQKPGDMLMSNGVKMNIIDMQKAMRPPGAPGAQPGH